MDILEKIGTALYDGEEEEVVEYVHKALDEGIEPQDILNNGLVAGMNVVGDDFKAGEIYLPDVISCAEAMKSGVRELKPALAAANQESVGTVVIGTVEGDVHDIGKNLVAVMLEGAGFTVHDIGVDLAPEVFVDSIDEYHPDIIGLSALLSTTMPALQRTIEAVVEAGKRDQVKIIVGGAPVNQDFADRIGADGYSGDAISAANLAKRLVQ
ncbi:MAG: corrinoid protein [Eggerthellaceae bacterium]|nr:corrinoid protein [Eggerthellaceae bacterium]